MNKKQLLITAVSAITAVVALGSLVYLYATSRDTGSHSGRETAEVNSILQDDTRTTATSESDHIFSEKKTDDRQSEVSPTSEPEMQKSGRVKNSFSYTSVDGLSKTTSIDETVDSELKGEIGEVLGTLISPSGDFIILETGQGGGCALWVFDVRSEQTHLVEGVRQGGGCYEFEWVSASRFEVTYTNYFTLINNPDCTDCIQGPFQSVSDKTPWVVS